MTSVGRQARHGAMLCFALFAGLSAGTAAAQPPKKANVPPPKAPIATDLPAGAESVTFETSDGVQIVGTYWRAGKGAKQAGVVVIPNLRTHTQRDWYSFASKLNSDDGLAVLTFDFRGFGQSVNVSPVPNSPAPKREDLPLRSEDTTRNATEIGKLLKDLDAVKQFLLVENNESRLNVRQYGILACGDLASLIVTNWLNAAEYGPRKNWSRDGGDTAALVIVSPVSVYKNYRTQLKLGDGSDGLPILLVTHKVRGGGGEGDKYAKALHLAALDDENKKVVPRPQREGGWMVLPPKKIVNRIASQEIGIELVRQPEYQAARDGIRGFLKSRLEFRRENPWESRDVDQSFRIIIRDSDKQK